MNLFDRQTLDDLGPDEPVFLIRGRDEEGPNLLRKYAFLLRARHPGALRLADEVEGFADELFAWQHREGNGAPPPSDPVEEEEPRDYVEEEVELEGPRSLEEEELLGPIEPRLES